MQYRNYFKKSPTETIRQRNVRNKYIASMETCHPRLSKMTWLVKCTDNPDGIDGEVLIKMSDEEIFAAYEQCENYEKTREYNRKYKKLKHEDIIR
jgi:hypothetical protein